MNRLQWGAETGRGKLVRALIAATLMTAFDGLIEPVAIQAGWWAWEGVHVPWFNYASWWGISFVFYLLPRQRRENIHVNVKQLNRLWNPHGLYRR